MNSYKYTLFLKRRFLPIFLAQFLGAFNDNLLRSGLVVTIAYAGANGVVLPYKPEVMVTLCSALLVLPFVLFSYLAGQVADKYEKSALVRLTKVAEVGIMLCAFYGFATQSIYLLMALLFVSGTHSTFFGPIKYSILPDHLGERELLAGNGFVSGGTYIGILFGLISGGLLVVAPYNAIGWAALAVACTGLAASLFLPPAPSHHPDMKIDFHILRGTADIVRQTRTSPLLFRSILGISWFLLIGSIYMSQFPNYAHGVMHANNEVYTLFLAIFSLGIAGGSVLADRLLKGEISTRLAALALLGVSVCTLGMVLATPVPGTGEALATVGEFLHEPRHWPVMGFMLLVAVCGGVYMVPLYAILQHRSAPGFRSRVVAASNMFDSLFMVVAAVVCAALLALGAGVTDLFLLLALLNLLAMAVLRKGLSE